MDEAEDDGGFGLCMWLCELDIGGDEDEDMILSQYLLNDFYSDYYGYYYCCYEQSIFVHWHQYLNFRYFYTQIGSLYFF